MDTHGRKYFGLNIGRELPMGGSTRVFGLRMMRGEQRCGCRFSVMRLIFSVVDKDHDSQTRQTR
jgi:hypothetical protein